jgi:8-oxo-dGTP diphosphatase
MTSHLAGSAREPRSRHATKLAVYLVLRRRSAVLLLRRSGSGWADGLYSLPAGHVEAAESALAALIREASEEIGVAIDPVEPTLVHAMHRGGDDYLDLYFAVDRWGNGPRLLPGAKADDLAWFEVGKLPENTVANVRSALEAIEGGLAYSEVGWAREGRAAPAAETAPSR